MEKESKPILLITGAGGQLGREFAALSEDFTEFDFILADKASLDVTVESWVKQRISEAAPAAVINCAAYTNVERSEDEEEEAMACNAHAAGYLADACHQANALLVHISTDYVFDGEHKKPYTETDDCRPLNMYGKSKLEGERLIEEKCERHIILRTSWLYSSFGHNFFKTMLRLAREKGELSVVNDQVASPTYARQFAGDILRLMKKHLIGHQHLDRGIYHYSQDGEASWYDFAAAICTSAGLDIPIHAVSTGSFPTKARRPSYSKLDNSKWKKASSIDPGKWEDGVAACMHDLSLQNNH